MTTRLRLHRDEDGPRDGAQGPGGVDEMATPEVLRFPLSGVRERLVGAKVDSDPRREAPRPGQERQMWATVEGSESIPFAKYAPESTATTELIHEIERTLERMQRRLDSFKDELDDTFHFPVRETDEGGGPDRPAA